MQFPQHWFHLPLLVVAATLGAAPVTRAQLPPEELLEDEHVREELGVNIFTAPSIKKILDDVRALGPIPYDEATRPVPSEIPSSRPLIALRLGGLIAQGFLIVGAERRDDVESLARAVLKYARSLSVSDYVMPRTKRLIELGALGDWQELREELARTQKDAEKALMSLRDEQVAHLISLGGWLRGLEISASAVKESYTPERAATLGRLEILDYFIDRLDTLHPKLKLEEPFKTITSELKTIRAICDKPEGQSIYQSDIADILQRVRTINDLILAEPKADAGEPPADPAP